MEELDSESLEFDIEFKIECEIYSVLKMTISKAIDKESHGNISIPKEILLENLLSYNLFLLDQSCAVTQGPDECVFLCGKWLFRPVMSDGKMLPMMEHLKKKFSSEKILYFPTKDGSSVRKKLWKNMPNKYSSYNLTDKQKWDSFNSDLCEKLAKMPHPPS